MKDFITLIDNFLDSKIDFKELENNFSELYLSDDYISEEEKDKFLSEIHYQIDYVMENPDKENKGYGFVDTKEFKEWLKDYKEKNIQFWKE